MSLITRRIWGFRILDLMAAGLLVALILSVYLAKTIAGSERSQITTVEREISLEHDRIRLLEAEVAHLERPDRLEELSVSYLNLAPIEARRETTPEDLARSLVAPVEAPKGPAL
jgi:hypothetical protein